PQVGVHKQPVRKDDRGAGAGLEIAEPALWQVELMCDSERRIAPGCLLFHHRRHLSFSSAGRLWAAVVLLLFPYPRRTCCVPYPAELGTGRHAGAVGRRAGRSGRCAGPPAEALAGAPFGLLDRPVDLSDDLAKL